MEPQIIDDVMGTCVFLELSDILLMLRSRIQSRLIALKNGFLGNFEDTQLHTIANGIFCGARIIGALIGTFVFLEVSDIFLMLRSRIHSRLIALKNGFLGNFEDTQLRIESSAEPKILMP